MRYLNQELLTRFADELARFRDQHQLSRLFSSRIDHLAVKTRDKKDYEQYKEEVLPICSLMVEANLNSRHIATAELNEGVEIIDSDGRKIGVAKYLEIMEPRPHKVGRDLIGIDHCELDIKSFAKAKILLREKGVRVNLGEGEAAYQHTLVVRLNDQGQEVKFSDEPLSEITAREIKEGISKALK